MANVCLYGAATRYFQGLLLPLCSTGSCTLREAVIFSSVLKRTSLPVLHSAAALLRVAQMPYCGTTSFFIRVLLDKKYALPCKVSEILWSVCHPSAHAMTALGRCYVGMGARECDQVSGDWKRWSALFGS